MAQAPRRASDLTPAYGWDERTGRYFSTGTGKFVRFQAVKGEIEAVAESSAANMRVISERLQTGQISLAEWRSQMGQEVKTIHIASGAAARGGWAQMSQSDWGYIGSRIRDQYKYLDNFAAQISSGEQPLNGRLLVRADMYAQAGKGSFEQMRRRYQEQNNGMTEERRVLTAKESCPDCIEENRKGWQPIGSLRRIGDSVCKTHCQCHFEYRRAEADGSFALAEDW